MNTMCLFKKQKTAPSITMEGETAIFNDGWGRIVRARPEQLKAIYDVSAGDQYGPNDQWFFIIEFDCALIVVPYGEGFMREFLNTWKKEILDNKKGFKAMCWYAPFKYCKRKYGFLPSYDIKLTITKPNRLHDFRWWYVAGTIPTYIFSE